MVEEVTGQLTAIRRRLEQACELLAQPTPQAMERGTEAIRDAARSLAGCESGWAMAAGDAMALEEAWRVRRSFSRAQRLMEHAAEFHMNWVRVRGTMAGGYTARGEAAPVLHGSRICVEG